MPGYLFLAGLFKTVKLASNWFPPLAGFFRQSRHRCERGSGGKPSSKRARRSRGPVAMAFSWPDEWEPLTRDRPGGGRGNHHVMKQLWLLIRKKSIYAPTCILRNFLMAERWKGKESNWRRFSLANISFSLANIISSWIISHLVVTHLASKELVLFDTWQTHTGHTKNTPRFGKSQASQVALFRLQSLTDVREEMSYWRLGGLLLGTDVVAR